MELSGNFDFGQGTVQFVKKVSEKSGNFCHPCKNYFGFEENKTISKVINMINRKKTKSLCADWILKNVFWSLKSQGKVREFDISR